MPGSDRISGGVAHRGVAYRNRTDDLRMARRITVVHGCPTTDAWAWSALSSENARSWPILAGDMN
jgi:hypothetical protein